MNEPRLIIADEAEGWAHVSIPKCGCKSIRRALESHFVLAEAPNVHNRQWPSQLTLDELRGKPSLFRWSVVRDPRARLVSTWAEKTQQMLPDGIPGLAECYRPLRGCTFAEFASWAAPLPVETEAVDVHIRACSWWLCDQDNEVIVDAVYLLESIACSWPMLQARFGFPALSHLNKSRHNPWESYFTPAIDAAVRAAYQQDFRLWYPRKK